MASYHLSVKSGAKGRGSSHADYIAREGKYDGFRGGEDLEYTAAGNLPRWAGNDPRRFWQAADEGERTNGSSYREYEVALPRELTPEQRRELVDTFIQEELGERHVWQYAIHNPKAGIDGAEQPHAHIMFSERVNDGYERSPDTYFRRANRKQPERGGAAKARFGETLTERRQWLVSLRERWAVMQNRSLEKYGHADRVDHRSLAVQGVDRIPEKHLGPERVRALTSGQRDDIREYREAETALSLAFNAVQSLPAPAPAPAPVKPPVNRTESETGERERQRVVSRQKQEDELVREKKNLSALQEKERKLSAGFLRLSGELDAMTRAHADLKSEREKISLFRLLHRAGLQDKMDDIGRKVNSRIPEENAMRKELKALRDEIRQSEVRVCSMEAEKDVGDRSPAVDLRKQIDALIDHYEQLSKNEGMTFYRSVIERILHRDGVTLDKAESVLEKDLAHSRTMKREAQENERDNDMGMER